MHYEKRKKRRRKIRANARERFPSQIFRDKISHVLFTLDWCVAYEEMLVKPFSGGVSREHPQSRISPVWGVCTSARRTETPADNDSTLSTPPSSISPLPPSLPPEKEGYSSSPLREEQRTRLVFIFIFSCDGQFFRLGGGGCVLYTRGWNRKIQDPIYRAEVRYEAITGHVAAVIQ